MLSRQMFYCTYDEGCSIGGYFAWEVNHYSFHSWVNLTAYHNSLDLTATQENLYSRWWLNDFDTIWLMHGKKFFCKKTNRLCLKFWNRNSGSQGYFLDIVDTRIYFSYYIQAINRTLPDIGSSWLVVSES